MRIVTMRNCNAKHGIGLAMSVAVTLYSFGGLSPAKGQEDLNMRTKVQWLLSLIPGDQQQFVINRYSTTDVNKSKDVRVEQDRSLPAIDCLHLVTSRREKNNVK